MLVIQRQNSRKEKTFDLFFKLKMVAEDENSFTSCVSVHIAVEEEFVLIVEVQEELFCSVNCGG